MNIKLPGRRGGGVTGVLQDLMETCLKNGDEVLLQTCAEVTTASHRGSVEACSLVVQEIRFKSKISKITDGLDTLL